MSTLFMPFEKAIRTTIKEGDKINPHGLYPRSKREVIIYPEETGHNENQIFTREKDLDFFFAMNKEGVPTFYGDTTKTRLCLVGEIGAEFAEIAINKACIPYSNLKMGLKVRPMTIKDVSHLWDKNKDTKKILLQMKSPAWLGSSYVSTCPGYAFFGVRRFGGFVYNYYLFDSYGSTYSTIYGVCPAVSAYLESKILVDLKESEKQGVWILIPKDKQITE